jgi:K+:H+ antiporter
LKLFDTTVGVVVLSAGVANDVVGWTLLAFSMALAKATSGLTALWVLAACVGWAAFLLVPGRRAFYWLAHRTGSMDNGPTMFFMTVYIILIWISHADPLITGYCSHDVLLSIGHGLNWYVRQNS